MQPSALVRRVRSAAGLTQAELAERAGVKQPEIARLESAGANPRVATLDKVVAATGHSLTLGFDGGLGIDESLIAGSLRTSPSERLRRFQSLYAFAQSAGGRALAARGS
jgi:transcriptional regulator with XRE-family HTH domain